MKRLIFDVDNTLIMWKDEYISALEQTLNEYKIDIDSKKVDEIVENLEKKHSILSKETLLDDINKEYNLGIKIDFIEKFLERQKELAEEDEKLIETMKYLSEKYELVILSNYFKEVQEGRLEKAGIRKYFTEIYGGDTNPVKPSKEAFEKAIGNHTKEDCIMIGDDLKNDIEGAISQNIRAIAIDPKNKIKENKEYIVIKKIEELKEIL